MWESKKGTRHVNLERSLMGGWEAVSLVVETRKGRSCGAPLESCVDVSVLEARAQCWYQQDRIAFIEFPRTAIFDGDIKNCITSLVRALYRSQSVQFVHKSLSTYRHNTNPRQAISLLICMQRTDTIPTLSHPSLSCPSFQAGAPHR